MNETQSNFEKKRTIWQVSAEILRASFSAVSTATIARVGAFFQIFRDLQDFHPFAPLWTKNFNKNLPKFFHIFTEFSQNFAKFRSNFAKFQRNFAGISPKFHRTCAPQPKSRKNHRRHSWKNHRRSEKTIVGAFRTLHIASSDRIIFRLFFFFS